jgi:hypothetical protein
MWQEQARRYTPKPTLTKTGYSVRAGFRVFSAALAVVLLQGCMPDSAASQLPAGTAAVVNGETITRQQIVNFVGELHDFRNLTADERGFFAARINEEERGALEQYIFAVVFRDLLAEQGLVFDADLLSQFQTGSLDNAGGEAQLRRTLQPSGLTIDVFNDAYLVQQVVFSQLREELVVGLTAEFRTVRHILVDDRALALELIARLNSGEDFADLASEYSTDFGSAIAGGDLGSAQRGAYVAPFEEAVWSSNIGLVAQPVETEFGFHIIDVQDSAIRRAEDLDENEQFALIQSELNTLLLAALDRADVKVDSAYGRWDKNERTIVPVARVGTARS